MRYYNNVTLDGQTIKIDIDTTGYDDEDFTYYIARNGILKTRQKIPKEIKEVKEEEIEEIFNG